MRREDLHQRSGARGRAAVLASAAAVALLLSGCSFNVKEELGLLNNGPDEFTVVKKKPLEMPEGQAALPEPRPGAASRVDPRPSEDAQIALTGRAAPTVTSDAPSKAENALLAAANVVPQTTVGDIGWKIIFDTPAKPSIEQVSELFFQIKQAFDDFVRGAALRPVIRTEWVDSIENRLLSGVDAGTSAARALAALGSSDTVSSAEPVRGSGGER